MAFAGKAFLLVFMFVAAVMFVGFASYVTSHASAVDVTISNTTTAYYDLQSQANQSINQSIRYASTMTNAASPAPLAAAILFVGGALFIFLAVAKR